MPSRLSSSAARCCRAGAPPSSARLLGALVIQLVRYTLLANGVPDPAALVVKAGAYRSGGLAAAAGAGMMKRFRISPSMAVVAVLDHPHAARRLAL